MSLRRIAPIFTAGMLMGVTLVLAGCGRTLPPPRDPGLWQERLRGPGYDETVLICLDRDSQRKVDLWGTQSNRHICSRNTLVPRPDGSWTFSSVCDKDRHGVVATEGVARGDFRRAWRMEAQVTTTGAQDPRRNGRAQVRLDARWLGPRCPPGVNPADVHIPRSAVRSE